MISQINTRASPTCLGSHGQLLVREAEHYLVLVETAVLLVELVDHEHLIALLLRPQVYVDLLAVMTRNACQSWLLSACRRASALTCCSSSCISCPFQ